MTEENSLLGIDLWGTQPTHVHEQFHANMCTHASTYTHMLYKYI